jgi:UDP:flavonoid glycosyltransferase YjiC (YdhE family)
LGVKPPYGHTTNQELRHAVAQVLAGGRYRENARRVGDSFRETGGFEEAADVIANMAARNGSLMQKGT